MSIARVGQPAPEFQGLAAFPSDQPDSPNQKIALSDYRGKWLVFFWYPLDFSILCPTEITAFSSRLDEFTAINTQILGASTDSIYAHRAWMNVPQTQSGIQGIRYPLLADNTHKVARDYGVLIEDAGIALRGLFIIDPEGMLQYMVVHNLGLGRSVDEVLRVLKGLQSGGMCPMDWKPGDKNL